MSPPGTPGWEASATAWLVGLFPDYGAYPGMRGHPVILSFTARHILGGAVEGARQGYRTTRSELAGTVPPSAVAAALNDLRTEGRRLPAALRSVELVEQALRAN